jgi:hypothetical protein
MHYVTLAMIASVVLAPYLTSLEVLPRLANFLPEMFSAIVAAYIVVAGARHRFQFVRASYWLAFGAIAVTMTCGIVANGVGTGPLVAGMRTYLRAIPLFFLPAIYDFKDWQIRNQLRFLLGLSLLQIPIAAYQRWIVLREHRFSGDEVVGTLQISSILSVFLISAVAVLTGMFLRGQLRKPTFFVLFFLLLGPTMINETKGTLLLLPLGLFAALLVGSPPGKRLRIVLLAIALLATFGAIFVPVYDYVRRYHPGQTSIIDFFSDKEAVEGYLSKGADVGLTEEDKVGRVDALIVPIKQLSRDPVHLVFGLGIGNVSDSALGDQFVGAHFYRLGRFSFLSTSAFMLEIGLLGTALVFLIYWLIFRDALAVAHMNDGVRGAIAIGWCGVTLVVTVACFYKRLHAFESLSYLFWYFSGLIAASRMRLALQAPSRLAVAPRVKLGRPSHAGK